MGYFLIEDKVNFGWNGNFLEEGVVLYSFLIRFFGFC